MPNSLLRSVLRLLAVLLVLSPMAAFAVEPDEMLKDPALEARARHISAGLRCLVCQNQSIDESDAQVAKDLRILIREQLMQNRTDQQVIDFVVDRYGDFVLLNPRFNSRTIILWLSPFLLVLAGGLLAWRRRSSSPAAEPLSESEKAELDKILKT